MSHIYSAVPNFEGCSSELPLSRIHYLRDLPLAPYQWLGRPETLRVRCGMGVQWLIRLFVVLYRFLMRDVTKSPRPPVKTRYHLDIARFNQMSFADFAAAYRCEKWQPQVVAQTICILLFKPCFSEKYFCTDFLIFF